MTSLNLQPGALLGRKYRLLRLLGEGGMGSVFEAQNELTLKRVAIKVMHDALSEDGQAAARMMREAQTASRVRHPNVVDVYDAGHEGDAVFLVMEYLEGESLADAMRRPGLPLHEGIALLIDAMRGVAAAHRVGVVHRDIKPENIFLAREGEHPRPVPKVLDFGISKLTDESGLRLTRTDTTIGTPLYMSYEQLCGLRDEVDGRADVYAFGVVLYELISGRTPYVAQTLAQLGMLIATVEPPALRQLRPEVPGALEAIVRRAIAKHREQRTPNLETLICELEPFATAAGFLQPLALGVPPPPVGLPRTLPVAASIGDDPTRVHQRDGGDRPSSPAAGTAPSLPAPRAARMRTAAVGTAILSLIGLSVSLALTQSGDDARTPASPPVSAQAEPAADVRSESAPLHVTPALARPRALTAPPAPTAAAADASALLRDAQTQRLPASDTAKPDGAVPEPVRTAPRSGRFRSFRAGEPSLGEF